MLFNRTRLILISTCMILCSSLAFANASVNSSATLVQRPKKETSIFSGFLNINRSSSLYDYQDGSRSDGMDYSGRLNMILTRDFSVRADSGYSTNLKDSTKSDFSDTVISLRRNPINVGRNFLFAYNLGVSLPTSKESSQQQSLQASTRAGIVVAINPDRLIKGFSITSTGSFARNFHEYETGKSGAVNNAYSSTQSLSVAYDFPIGLSLSADFAHRNAWSYQNNLKEAYEFSEEISYQFNSAIAASVGHSNSGSALRPNGQDYGFDMYNENTSVVYASLTLIF